MKRYLRLDIEYDTFDTSKHYMPKDDITRILAEEMPYIKVIFSRDTSIKEDLDKPKLYTK